MQLLEPTQQGGLMGFGSKTDLDGKAIAPERGVNKIGLAFGLVDDSRVKGFKRWLPHIIAL